MENKIQIANMVESQFQQLASEGKMKLQENGQVQIVEDQIEREFLMKSYKKDREQQQIEENIQGENLMDRFNEADNEDLE